MRAAITGAHGFVGRHLAEHLVARGDVVIPLDVDDREPVDVTDPDAVTACVEETRPDVIYHLAARSHVGESWHDEKGVTRVNVDGTANVLAAAADVGVERVLVVGSAEQYGRVDPGDVPVSEDTELRPVSPYARSKAAAEALARRAADDGLGVVCVRAFGHTGPGQTPRFLVPALAARVAEAEVAGEVRVTIGNTAPVRDLSDVRDVVRAYRLLVLHGAPGAVYNVCSGVGTSVGEIATRLLALATRPLRLEVDPALVRPDDLPVLVGDAARLVAATGWRPQHALDTTLRDVLDEARAQLT
jgi:GDP-4-dehydro-6-deoxy-D-mannose reductase